MTGQFRGRLTRDALRRQLAGEPALQHRPPSTAAASKGMLLQVADFTPDTGTDQELVTSWLTRLHLLQGVPFNYLVPDIGMLPAESIRFFQVDNNWIEALLDGAYSLGFAGVAQGMSAQARSAVMQTVAHRVYSGTDRKTMLANARSRSAFTALARPAALAASPAPEVLSGFLLRSAVVTGWPGMQAKGYSDTAGTNTLSIVRMETVGPSMLLCLFAGVIARVDFQEPSEGVHFGLDSNGTAWKKDLRYANGNATTPIGSFNNANVPVSLRAGGAASIVPMNTLAQSMASAVWTTPPPADTDFTSAQFGLEMVEGLQAVSFQLASH